MGHDVLGFKRGSSQEVAYLRRSAFNEQARDIYRFLGAQQFDAGCSGCGERVVFETERIAEALSQVPSDESHDQERAFLKALLEHATTDGAVEVGFY